MREETTNKGDKMAKQLGPEKVWHGHAELKKETLNKALLAGEKLSEHDSRLDWLEKRISEAEDFIEFLKENHESCTKEERLAKFFYVKPVKKGLKKA